MRRAFLCGRDSHTGQDYSHRRDWIVNREEQLAGLFAIDVEFRTELSNHLHLVLRTMPRIARRWTAEEVVRRWLTITKLAKCFSDDLPTPSPQQVEKLAQDKKLVAKLRPGSAASPGSWASCAKTLRGANREDDCKGRFFETRFSCRECTDLNAILLCGTYVDLNPYRAGEVDNPVGSRYTSVYQRLQAQGLRKNAAGRPDGWLGEFTLAPERKADEPLADASRTGRRASDLGTLPVSLDDYVRLLRWTAQQLRSGQRDTILADLATVLDHFEVQQDQWLDTVEQYESAFGHAVGRPVPWLLWPSVWSCSSSRASQPVAARSPNRRCVCELTSSSPIQRGRAGRAVCSRRGPAYSLQTPARSLPPAHTTCSILRDTRVSLLSPPDAAHTARETTPKPECLPFRPSVRQTSTSAQATVATFTGCQLRFRISVGRCSTLVVMVASYFLQEKVDRPDSNRH